jgi:pyridoxal phosphate-dependent aminotransferase EpsN
MLATDSESLAARARHLATQAKDAAPHYEHSAIGFNYRMSNLLAAIGCGQLSVLEERVAARRANFEFYQRELGGVAGVQFMPEAPWGRSTRWLTCALIDPSRAGASCEELRVALEAANIEARPLWKPMHLQPVHAGAPRRGGEVAEQLFRQGLCLPSGSSLTEEQRWRVVECLKRRVGRQSIAACPAAGNSLAAIAIVAR